MANIQITQLPSAGAITGTEAVPIVQNGQTVQTTTGAISASPSQTQTFVTVNQEPTLPNSRALTGTSGIGVTDNGAQSTLSLSLQGAAASLNSAATGFAVKTNTNTITPRNIAVSGSGVAITDGDGQAGNPTISLSGQVAALANVSANGLMTITTAGNISATQIQGTSSQIGVANGTGVSGYPTISIADNPTLPGTGAVLIPIGTDVQAPVGTNGQFRFNSTTSTFDGYTAGSWRQFSLSGGVTSFSAGTTGFAPSSTTSGAVTLSGTLNVANGGTGGTATPTAGTMAYGNGTAYAFTAAGTSGQVLTSAGAGTPTWTTPTTGTVTAVSVATANGLAGTSSGGATPALTLSTTITGVLKGNGTAISAATSGTDYAPATSGTSILYGNGSGGFSNVTIGTGVAFAGGTLSATGSGGTVTSVAALTLGTTGTDLSSTVATSTTTPVITLNVPTASATNRGALSAADWTTFNNKGSGSVTSVSFTGGIISVATATTTPALTVAGTSGGIPYFSSASTWATSAALTANAIVLGGGAGAAPSVLASLGTTSTVLHGNAAGAPTFGAVSLTADVSGTLPVANGGTGVASYAVGDIIYASGTTTLSKLPVGTNGYVLTLVSGLPAWQATTGGVTSFSAGTTGFTPSTSTTGAVTLAGTLGIANGGTNSTATATAGGAGYGTGTAHAYTAAGTAGQVLTSAGASAPTWSGIAGGTF